MYKCTMYKCTMYAADNRPFKTKRTREDALFLPSYINCTSYIVPSYIFLAIFLFLFAYMQKKVYLCSRKGLRADVGRAWMRSKND